MQIIGMFSYIPMESIQIDSFGTVSWWFIAAEKHSAFQVGHSLQIFLKVCTYSSPQGVSLLGYNEFSLSFQCMIITVVCLFEKITKNFRKRGRGRGLRSLVEGLPFDYMGV